MLVRHLDETCLYLAGYNPEQITPKEPQKITLGKATLFITHDGIINHIGKIAFKFYTRDYLLFLYNSRYSDWKTRQRIKEVLQQRGEW